MKRPRKSEKTPRQEGAENPNPKPRKRVQPSELVVQRPSEEGKGIFSNEILTNILSRLPAKSLLRFTSVSKWWYDLVSSPQLPWLHLQTSLETSPNDLALVFQDNSAYYSVEMDKVENFDMTVSAQVDRSLAAGSSIVASCNGLLCLRAEKDNAILFNLVTQTRYDLPTLLGDHPDRYPPNPVDPDFGYQTHTQVRFGFGYDSTCHDYKVWRICVFTTDINNCAFAIIAKVYSLKANKWTRVKDFPEKICDFESDSGVLCNETLHWIASVKNENHFYRTGIVGFELHGEKYRQLSVPNNHGFEYYEMSLGVLDGCLCVTYTPSQSQSNNVATSVRVMKEYGSQESWTKLFNIGLDEIIKPIRGARPLTYSKSRDEVLVDLSCSGLIWYDLRNEKTKECVGWKPYYPGREVCMRSLVSPKTGSFNKKNGEELACGPFVWKSDDYNPYDDTDPYYVLTDKKPYYDSDSDGFSW